MGECEHYVVNYDRMVSDFLYARPSRLSGVARLFDLFCVFQLYNVSASRKEADCRATFSDWVMVGRDLKDATEAYGEVVESSSDRECITAQP